MSSPSQPPEGLRELAVEAASAAHRAGKFTVYETVDAVLAALFAACEVREEWPMTFTSNLMAVGERKTLAYNSLTQAIKAARICQSATIQHQLRFTWSEPVSSTGEEKTDG